MMLETCMVEEYHVVSCSLRFSLCQRLVQRLQASANEIPEYGSYTSRSNKRTLAP
jgi:hypothetical protein